MCQSKYWTGVSTGQFKLVTEAVHLMKRALELARRLDDPETFWFVAACAWFLYVDAPQHAGERRLLAEELAGRPRTGVTMRTLGTSLAFTSLVLLESGQRQFAETLYNECWEVVERSGQANLWFLAMMVKGPLATIGGRLEEADEIGRQIRARGEELDLVGYAALMEALASTTARIFLGKNDEVARMISKLGRFATLSFIFPMGAVRKDEAEEILERNVMARQDIGTPEDESSTYMDISLLMMAVEIGHRPAAELLLSRLANSGLPMAGFYSPTSLDRHLGGAAALLERYDEARTYYQRAIKATTEMHFRPELALTRLQLAELLLEHYPKEKKEALEHLDFAISEFREMKMQPSLERALRHKDILKA
jgi:tetratricopeptide (TPR) repeat protein